MINDLVQLVLESEHFYKDNIKKGTLVLIVLKEHQRTEYLTYGKVKDILTGKKEHTRGIKVRLETGHVGRVQKILSYPIKHITFPSVEYSNLIEDLSNGYDILTTRISKEKNKYKLNDILSSDLGYYLEVFAVQTYNSISKHPYISYLNSDQKKEIGNNPFDIVYLRKLGKINEI